MAKVPYGPKGQKQKVAELRRGEIYLCSFDPTVGYEIKKPRPALVIQNDVGNRYSPLTVVAAITSSVSADPDPPWSSRTMSATAIVHVRSSVRLDQIRTAVRQRRVRRLGVVDTATRRGLAFFGFIARVPPGVPFPSL